MASKLGSEEEAVGAAGYKAWLKAQEGIISWETELGVPWTWLGTRCSQS